MLLVEASEAVAHIKRVGIKIDPAFRGECERLADNAGVKRAFFRKSGQTIDGLAESLWDAGLTAERLGTVETLDLLESLLGRSNQCKRSPRTASKREALSAEQRARKMRLRKYQCPSCSQIVRGCRTTSVLCGICWGIEGKAVELVRVDSTPEEILEAAEKAGVIR